jgi:hypothetical protein
MAPDAQAEAAARAWSKMVDRLIRKGSDPGLLAIAAISFGARYLALLAGPQRAAEACRITAEKYAALGSAASPPARIPHLRMIK